MIELRVADDGRIEEAAFLGSGCIISQAAASMLVEHMEGISRAQAEAITAREMLGLFRARLTPRRQPCCLLAWEALRGALAGRQQQR